MIRDIVRWLLLLLFFWLEATAVHVTVRLRQEAGSFAIMMHYVIRFLTSRVLLLDTLFPRVASSPDKRSSHKFCFINLAWANTVGQSAFMIKKLTYAHFHLCPPISVYNGEFLAPMTRKAKVPPLRSTKPFSHACYCQSRSS
jgi:hypothetical protein